uniref:Amidinotransferase n=1 Tax=Panagrolaimus superbus TaxID=310955 RepID=A0A914Z8V7_9BILA
MAAPLKSATNAVKKILMTRPTYFTVKYSINPWMDPSVPVNEEKAGKQWETLKSALESAGAAIEVLEPNGAENFPDLVFAANAAVVRGKRAYLANFHYAERKGEKFFFDRWFKENGYETVGDDEIAFEGAGDALWAQKNRSKLFCGVGPRTDARALDDVAKKLKNDEPFTVFGCQLVDPRFYHIDTCFCPLNEEVAIWYPKAFDQVSQHNMKNEIELVAVNEKDAKNFACNAVVVGKNVVMNQGSDETGKTLEKLGYKPIFVDMSEFIKSGGSAKCCTLLLE